MLGERRKGKNERMVERRNSVAQNMGIEERNNYGTRQLKAGSGKTCCGRQEGTRKMRCRNTRKRIQREHRRKDEQKNSAIEEHRNRRTEE